MEGKANQYSEPLSICHRLFNFLARTLAFYGTKRVTLGNPAPKRQEEKTSSSSGDQLNASHAGVEDAMGSQLIVEHDVNREPLVMIPVVEILETDELEGKNELPQKAKGQQTAIQRKSSKKKAVLKKKPSASTSRSSDDAREKERVKDTAEVLKKHSSSAQAQEKDEDSKVPSRPAKPKLGQALNIDEKSGAFIQSRKEALRAGSSLRDQLLAN